jgi:hypothetical protein
MIDSLFKEVFGDSPTIKILEWFLESRGLGYTIKDVAESQEIDLIEARKSFKRLTEKGILIKTKPQFYTLNLESQISKDLIILFDNIINNQLRK